MNSGLREFAALTQPAARAADTGGVEPVSTAIPRPFEERLLTQIQRLQSHAEHRAGAAAADDVVQETLLRAWRCRDSFDPAREIWPWLKTVAERAAARRFEVEARQPATDGSTEVEHEPGRQDDGREPPFDVRPFLAKLRPEEREVVERFYFGGASIAEIARDRSCAEGTVKSQLSRARTRLAGMLAGLVLALGAIFWTLWPARSSEPVPARAPAPARLAFHSLTVEHVRVEAPKLATKDLSKTTHRGWVVVGAVTPETERAPKGRKKP